MFHTSENQKRPRVTTFTSQKIDFMLKMVKETIGHYNQFMKKI